MREPSTEAGRRLLEDVADMNAERGTEESTVVYRDAILAIEDEARAPLVAALEMVRDWQDLDSPEGIAIMLHEVRAALSREDRP